MFCSANPFAFALGEPAPLRLAHSMRKLVLLANLLLWTGLPALTALDLGATREEVLQAYGPPRGTSQAGPREILNYDQGRVVLEHGRVTDWHMPPPPATETPTPPATTAALPAPPPPANPDRSPPPPAPAATKEGAWFTDYEAALAEAARTQKRVLALFTGTDWCPPCQRFEASVAHSPEFLDYATIQLVLLKLDFPRSTPQPEALRAQNHALLARHGISAYPTFLLLDAQGEPLARLNSTRARPADSPAEYYVLAIEEALRRSSTPARGLNALPRWAWFALGGLGLLFFTWRVARTAA